MTEEQRVNRVIELVNKLPPGTWCDGWKPLDEATLTALDPAEWEELDELLSELECVQLGGVGATSIVRPSSRLAGSN
jgi:hypothetical protein